MISFETKSCVVCHNTYVGDWIGSRKLRTNGGIQTKEGLYNTPFSRDFIPLGKKKRFKRMLLKVANYILRMLISNKLKSNKLILKNQ
jgi:hypothetical protein